MAKHSAEQGLWQTEHEALFLKITTTEHALLRYYEDQQEPAQPEKWLPRLKIEQATMQLRFAQVQSAVSLQAVNVYKCLLRLG